MDIDDPPPLISSIWKGHPQPPADERLQSARIFLADEDPDRCIDFASRIAEIEEYVAFLETDCPLEWDQKLLQDVKVKLAVHRDWEQRRKDGIPDLGCDKKPWQLPFSTRSSAAQAQARPNPVRVSDGQPTQVRDDHPPFSVRREDDHSQFIAALKKDSSGDPDEVDIETNLIYSESRAYSWALRDPVLIPSWMHPIDGIPRKGVSVADSAPWYRDANVVPARDTTGTRPARGWIPGYLLAREQRINSLLKETELSDKDMEELEDLLHFVEPPELQRLHAETVAFDKDDALGLVTAEEEEYRLKISTEFAASQEQWMSTFTSVYFIVNTSQPETNKSKQPGVFYIEHGVMNSERQATLDRANRLLAKVYTANGDLNSFSREELVELEVYLQFSQPISITSHGRRRAAILRQVKASGEDDLEDADKQLYDAIHREEYVELKRWIQSIASASPQLRYLRPGEMADDPADPEKPEVLYIPWSISSVPPSDAPILLESALPAQVLKFQETMNLTLSSIDENEGDDISEGMDTFLQIAYPDLRALGARWLRLRSIENKRGVHPEELRISVILDRIFTKKFRDWRYGLLDPERNITIKLPSPGQEDERPGILYYRNARRESNDEDRRTIQELLDRESNRTPAQTSDLRDALVKYQFPVLRRLHEDYQSTVANGKANEPLRRRWLAMMTRWIRTLEGSFIELKRPSSSTLPCNDPYTVYFRGKVVPSGYSFNMSEEQALALEDHIHVDKEPLESFEVIGDVPLDVRGSLERFKRTNRIEDGLLYALHLESWYHCSEAVPIYGYPYPVAGNEGSIKEPDSVASLEGGDEPPSPSSTSESQPDSKSLGVDLSLMLPQIQNVEKEINRIANIIRAGKLDRALTSRFHLLLQQFIPQDIHLEKTMIDRQREQLLYKPNPRDKKDLIMRRDRMREAYNCWLRDIIQYGVSIRVSPESYVTGSKVQLDFNLQVAGSGEYFHVLGPSGTTVLSNSQTRSADLILHGIPVELPNALGFTEADKRVVRGFERNVNSLLAEQAQGSLSWDDSESLLSKLRYILPPGLQDREREHFAIDKRAREAPLPQEKDAEFWESWGRWSVIFNNWISTIPGGKVIIATGDATQDATKTIQLNVSDITELQTLASSRPETLPYPVKNLIRDVNDYLYGNFATLSTEERQKRESILWQLFRPIYAHLRRQLNTHIQDEYFASKSQAVTTELDSLNGSISLRCCSLYRDILRTLTDVTIEEPVPGVYKLAHAPILGPHDANSMSDKTENERIATMLFDIYCQQVFFNHRKDFLMITTKIKRGIKLTPGEDSMLLKNLTNVAKSGLKEIQVASDLATKLALEASQSGQLSKSKEAALIEADSLCTWYRWVLTSLPQSIKVSMPPGALRTMVDILLSSRRRPRNEVNLVLVEPPSISEMKELQVVLNNLMMREKMNLTTSETSNALDFLLIELLSPSLRILKTSIDTQEAGLQDLSSESMASSIGFLEAQKGFQSRFQHAKRELKSRFGIVLDSWWYSEAVIFAAAARWKLWKSANQAEDGTPKLAISITALENDLQQEQFKIYALLTDWVSKGCPSDVSIKTSSRLILKAITSDPGFDSLQNQIRDTTASMQASEDSDDPTNSVFLLGIQEELIKSYMRWYSSQSRSELEGIRKQYASTEVGTVDFSGKAERRGIQRAAIEISLNLLASNQEQHRPADRFRVLDLTRAHVPIEKEIPISLPLEPSRRQAEPDSFGFTKKLLAFKDWKEFDYEVARTKILEDPAIVIQAGETLYGKTFKIEKEERKSYAILDPPVNYSGPFVLADEADVIRIAGRRQAELSRIALRLQNAYTKYPRPLLERLLTLVSQGMDGEQVNKHPLYDTILLSKQDLELLEHISEDSWDEIVDDSMLDSMFPGLRRLHEFEADLQKMAGIPFWSPRVDSDGESTQESSDLVQVRYSPDIPSRTGVPLNTLTLELQKIKGNTTYVQSDMRRFLLELKNQGKIHYDDEYGEVSLIPYSGHPENKYVTSREEALELPYIRRDLSDRLVVQYDASGRSGPPIVQPNKYEHFQRLAFRLGRDTLQTLQTLQKPLLKPKEIFAEQYNAGVVASIHMEAITPEDRGQPADTQSVNLSDINVVNIAREVCCAAPHLALELNIELPYRNPYSTEPEVEVELNTTEAASLIQLKILEELSDNFEPKLPVNETVWDFAEERLATTERTINGRKKMFRKQQTKYFSVRRYPICCQTQATKEAIRTSGPVMQVEPAPEPVLTAQQQYEQDLKDDEEAAAESARGPVKTARHIRGQRPYYPFGETPYQETYQSFVMEQELKDVAEFQPPKPTGILADARRHLKGIFGTESVPVEVEPEEETPAPDDPYALPKIPARWKPDNISLEEKRLRLIEEAKATRGFPDPKIQEYYHTQEEIEVGRVRAETLRGMTEMAANDAEVARALGKDKSKVTAKDWAAKQVSLNINPRTGLKIPKADAGPITEKAKDAAKHPGPTVLPLAEGQPAAIRHTSVVASAPDSQVQVEGAPIAAAPQHHRPVHASGPRHIRPSSQQGRPASVPLAADQEAAGAAGVAATGNIGSAEESARKLSVTQTENERLRRRVADLEAAADANLQASILKDAGGDDVDMG
ncbi:hypothetical protein VTL71DRAFT_9290 [Oculimacula yallundae]|uniref:Uncharacterized protein n=1 Tax=Oculimacula yallundae TaxID=86028 RepID=A0ABR4BUC5_9HELO